MAFDKDVPVGNTKISIGDNGVRANNTALEDALDLEHTFATGGVQTGRHRFVPAAAAARDSASPAYVNGSIHATTGIRTDPVLQSYDGATWTSFDVDQPNIARKNENGQFTRCQFSNNEPLAIAGGAIVINCATPPTKAVVLTEDISVGNPLSEITGYLTTILLDVIQDGTGGHSITWGNAYRSPTGSVQIGTLANQRTLVQLSQRAASLWIVQTLPNYSQAIT